MLGKIQILNLVMVLASLGASPVALAARDVPEEIVKKILTSGVPEKALTHVLDFRSKNMNREFQQDVYTCAGKDPASIRPCEEEKRSKSQKAVTLNDGKYLVIIDFTKSSMDKRLFYINLEDGKVETYRVAHGKGTGELYSYKFSNIKDSKQTSLGIYLAGGTYTGDHGLTLRLYGLDRSNDQAYNRDIVFHGSWYAEDSFPKSINARTGKPYNRLGQSWGCPAVDTNVGKRLIPLLKENALIYHYYPSLEEEAMSGKEVVGENLDALMNPPLPTKRPDPNDKSANDKDAKVDNKPAVKVDENKQGT